MRASGGAFFVEGCALPALAGVGFGAGVGSAMGDRGAVGVGEACVAASARGAGGVKAGGATVDVRVAGTVVGFSPTRSLLDDGGESGETLG